MTHYEYVILEIIGNYNEGKGISSQILDRLFYDKRADEGISLDNLHDVRWIPVSEKLQDMGLITIEGLRKKITSKGIKVLQKYKENQS